MGTWEKTIFRGRGTEKRAPGREHGKGLLGQEGETDRDVEDVKGEGEQDEGVCGVQTENGSATVGPKRLYIIKPPRFEKEARNIPLATMTSAVSAAPDLTAVAQRTAAWFAARDGKVTGSWVAKIFNAHPFGSLRSGADTLMGRAKFRGNQATTYGTWSEDKALEAYRELMTPEVVTVRETGFHVLEHPPLLAAAPRDEGAFVGGSPDGLLQSTDESGVGVLEIKCQHSKRDPVGLRSCKYHVYQMQFNMFCVGNSTWSHYVSYTPRGIEVWRVARADTVPMGPLDGDVPPDELAYWTREGVYDPASKRWVGYGRVLFSTVRAFWLAVRGDTEGTYAWMRDFAFDHDEAIRLVTAVHAGLFRPRGSADDDDDDDAVFGAEFVQRRMFETPRHVPVTTLAAAQYPRQISWTALMAWQMDYIARARFKRRINGRLRRFALVSPDGTKVRHACELVEVKMPPWSHHYEALCIDIIHGEAGRMCKSLTLAHEDTEPQEIAYFPWEARELPAKGTLVVTSLCGGRVDGWGVLPWAPPDDALGSYDVDVVGDGSLVASFDPLGMYVTLVRRPELHEAKRQRVS